MERYRKYRQWIVVLLFFLSIRVFGASFNQSLCRSDGFSCLRLKHNQSWISLWPDEHDRSIMMRVNRMNIGTYPGMVLAVPYDLESADIMDFSPFPLHIDPPNEKLIIIDPAKIAFAAYESDGTLVRWGPAVSGADWCKDIDRPCRTKPGRFRIYSLGSSNCISSKFPQPDGGAPMPYCMFFNGGQALHGSPRGVAARNSSHGCVRLYVNDAEWLRYDFAEGPSGSNGYRGTKVVVRPYADEDEDDS